MLSSRDKLLAGLFAVQLTAAAAFGAVLVHGLHHETGGTLSAGTTAGAAQPALNPADALPTGAAAVVATPAAEIPGAAVAAPVAGASAGPAASGPAGVTGPQTVSSVVGGSAGTAGTGGTSKTATGKSSSGAKTAPTTKASATAAATAAAAAAAGASEIAPGAPIKIGSIVSESGAINFNSSAQGTKAYIDMVNAAGGVAGHKIQLIQDDDHDQLNSNTGDAEFKSLANQGVFAFGAFQAPDTEGGLQGLLDQYQIPLIGSYGERAEYVDKLAFAFTAYYAHYGYEMGLYLKGLGVKNPALIFVTNNDSQSDNSIIKGFTDGFGGPPAYQKTPTPTTTSAEYQNYVLGMHSAQVDGLATILDPASYSRFLQAAGTYATQLKHVADPLFAVPSVASQSNAQGTYIASDFAFTNSTDPAIQQYVSTVQGEFGSNAGIDYIGEVGWFDAKLIVDALKSMNGVFTKAGLVKAVEGLGTYTTPFTSPLNFAPNVRDINRCLQFGKITNNVVVPTQGYTCDSEPVS